MPPKSFRIREATAADIPGILAIYGPEVETGLASWEEAVPSEAEMAARMGKILALRLPYLVADRGGQVLGYSHAGPFHPRSAYRYTLEDTVYLHPESRGWGMGRALLSELLRRCESLGCRQMMALIYWTAGSASVALHERLGFRMVGIAHGLGYKFGAWHDLVYMQRPLGPGSAAAPDYPVPGFKRQG